MSERPSRPRQKKQRKSRNPLRHSVKGQESYTEVKTNLGEVMSGKHFANSALAGLAAREDLKQVRLRSASRNRNEGQEFLPYKHPMLIKFKGRRHVRPRIVAPNFSSLNHWDSFILVLEDKIFTFVPELTNVAEKAKVTDFAKFICATKDLGTNAIKPTTASINDSKLFWDTLGGKMDMLKKGALDIDLDEEDEEYENSQFENDRCWRLNTDPNTGIDTLIPEMAGWAKCPSQTMLNSSSVYVFEFGHEVYYWIGSQVSFPKRRSATKLVKKLWTQFERRNRSHFLLAPNGHRHEKILK